MMAKPQHSGGTFLMCVFLCSALSLGKGPRPLRKSGPDDLTWTWSHAKTAFLWKFMVKVLGVLGSGF